MKKMLSSISVSLLLAAMLTGCGGTAKNTVHNQDDLKNKTIGTQLGTTGYVLASDIEGAKVEPYNKGADAVQALIQGKIDAVIIDSEPAKVFEDNTGANGTLIMATNAEFPPYESMADGEIVGIDVDMMNAVCDELGMKLEIENMEFDSVIAAVNSGKADVAVAGLSVTPEREKNVSFTQGYTTTKQVIITRKD